MQATLTVMTDTPPKPPRAVVQTTVRVDPEVYASAQRDAAVEGISLNEWIVQAMRERSATKARRPKEE